MFNYVWPLALIVVSNVFYNVCAKSVPEAMNPFASLTVTYAVGAVISLVLFFVLGRGNLFAEYGKVNFAPFVLGVAIVGLEVGYIYAYQAGWPISTAQIVQSAILAIILIIVGTLFYKEHITLNKIIGVVICLIGLAVINFK